MGNLWSSIIAGGNGTRLFLYSNQDRPKQFCLMDKSNTFIQATAKRFIPYIADSKHIMGIVTNNTQRDLAKEQLMDPHGVLSKNIIEINPNHGYAGALCVATQKINKIDPGSFVISTASDQFVEDNEAFRKTMNLAISESMSNHSVVFIGVNKYDRKTLSDLGVFTYSGNEKTNSVFQAVDMFEKPKGDLLDKIMQDEKYTCNTGISVWPSDIFESYEEGSRLPGPSTDAMIKWLLKNHGVKIVIGEDFDWDDCGNFKALHTLNRKSNVGNGVVLLGETQNIDYEDCEDVLLITDESLEINVYGGRKAAVIARRINGENYLEVAAFDHNGGVALAAECFSKNPEEFKNGLYIGGDNNEFINSLGSKFHLCVIGKSNVKVNTYRRRSGRCGYNIVFCDQN